MSDIKTVLRNTFFYSSSSLLLRASSIFFFPIFSYYLSKSDYGILSVTQSILSIIATFSGLQLGRGITRFTTKGITKDSDPDEIASILRTCFTLTFLLNFIIFLIFTLFGNSVLKSVLNDIPYFPYVFISFMSMPFVAVFGLYKTYLQAQHDGKKVFTIDMLYFGGNIGLNLLLVAVFKMGAMGIIYSTLANSFIFVGYFLIKEPQFFLPKLDLNAIKPLIKYSFPFIPFIFFGFLMENTDRLFLNSKSGSGDSGIYYIALTFASIFSIVKESLIGALRPWFFENYNEENFRKIGKIFLITLWGMAILAVGISAFSYETLFILSSNKELINAWKYIPLLVIGLFIVFVGQIYSLPTQHSSTAVKYLFIANFVGFIANLIISFLLIERYKIFGAVTAKIFAYTIMTLVLFVINNALTKFKLNPLYVFLPFLYSTILSLGVLVEISYPVNLTIKTIVLTVSVLLFGFYVNKTLGGLDQLKSIFIKSEHNN